MNTSSNKLKLTSADHPVWTAGFWLVLAASTFNVGLCFIQTRGWSAVGTAVVAAAELVILAAAMLTIRQSVSRLALSVTIAVVLYVAAAKLINNGVNVKVIHDLAITYVFYELGRRAPDRAGLWTLSIIVALVVAFGVFELLFTDLYGQILDVWSYYVSKGVIAEGTTNYSGTDLFISGNRGGAMSRTFFPALLGSHRVSSIFLEPVSLGNFAAIVFAWALSTWTRSRRGATVLAFAAMTCVVLADSRFAGGCCVLMLLIRLTPASRSSLLAFGLPVLAAATLTMVGADREIPDRVPAIINDDLPGRLLFSGRLLGSWNLPDWLAFAPSPVYTADTGYAYLANDLGLPLCLLIAGLFAFHRCRNDEASLFRTMIAIYMATALCVTPSVFSIKTAGLLWFLYGCLDRPHPRAIAWPMAVDHRRTVLARTGRALAPAARHASVLGVVVGVALAAGSVITSSRANAQAFRGVNLAGPAFASGKVPGRYGWDYLYPNGHEVDYFTSHGMNAFRVSVLWERLQPALGGPLDPAELARLQGFVRLADNAGAMTIIDIHNYGAYRGTMIGTGAVAPERFRDLWTDLARVFGRDPHVMFGLMNEPKIASAVSWRDDQQGAIDAIRATGASNTILVSGVAWDGAARFAAASGAAMNTLHDPRNRLVFEVHQYFDTDSSGTKPDCVSPDAATGRLVPFTAWLRANHHRGFLGEFGVSRDPKCLPVLAAVASYLRDNADVWLGWTYWAAGPLWGNYMFTIEPPKGGGDRPQMQALQPFLQAHPRT